ncbi:MULTISPECIES: ribose-phosphate diphosphokinase [Enterococcus]|uniref:Putative ribose-phosphate pyrophosphokinase n=1 Tax=Enterococcus alishanensis TaxID=1303817 RepID=A0ABS6T8J2_9ENTE|nr:ribose-phosphate diphosphokinase [Enterococcus alishanensis]MBV7389224.1 ribose-phosphate diphosphokinase [Enterococcus alishanensis]
MSNESIENKFKIFSLNGNVPLAEKIAEVCGVSLGKSTVKHFSDGEIAINIEETVRGYDVYLVQSTNDPVNDNYMELLIMIDAMKRASAKTVNVVLPYYGYARQDRTAKPHEPITAKLIANLLTDAGANRILTLDLHTVQVQGFFDIPVDNLFTMPLFAHYYRKRGMVGEDYVVVSPKNSGVTRARSLAEYLDTTIAIVDEEEADNPETGYVIGDVKGKTCIMVDDILNTGIVFVEASKTLMKEGAKEVVACASHGLLSTPAKELLDQTEIKDICVTDSVSVPEERHPDKLSIISCGELLGLGVKRIYNNQSVSPLFTMEPKNYE